MTPFTYEHQARSTTTALVVAGVWLAIGLAIWVLEASPMVMGIIALFTLPAIYDLISNRRSGVRISSDGLHWFSGKRTGDVTWNRLSHMRLDTRLDFSVRASAVLITGKRLRLPLESIPPADTCEAALTERGIKVERHHFSLVG